MTDSKVAWREVVARLLALNHQRYEEEQTKDEGRKTKARGTRSGQDGKKAKGKKAGKEQWGLL